MVKITIIGCGYVGLVSGACFAEWGNTVICTDINQDTIATLNQGTLPLYEPGLKALINENCLAARLSFTSDIATAVSTADIIFITVGTPLQSELNEPDLSFVKQAAESITPSLKDNAIVVLKSTVPVGTSELIEQIISKIRQIETISVVSNPEFLREGVAIADFLNPDRIVIGVEDDFARSMMTELYRPTCEAYQTPLVFTQRRTAELIKYAANAFLATKLTFMNELADLCEQMQLDSEDLSLGMGLDKRIGTGFLKAGPGYGGSCFPKDTMALLNTADSHGVSLNLVKQTIVSNEMRKHKMAQKVVKAAGGTVSGQIIAILGLTFKPDTDDMREASSIPLIKMLQQSGAIIHAHDPMGISNAAAILSDVAFFDDAYTCARGADVVVVVTEWDSIRQLDLKRLKNLMKNPVMVDLRRAFASELAAQAGFVVTSVGK